MQDHHIAYPVLLDQDGVIGDTYPARLMPTTYVIDHDGRIVDTKIGVLDEATLTEHIAALLR